MSYQRCILLCALQPRKYKSVKTAGLPLLPHGGGAPDGGGADIGAAEGAAGILDPLQQDVRGQPADLGAGYLGRGERRLHHSGLGRAVEPGHQHPVRDGDAHLLERRHQVDGDEVVGAQQRVGQCRHPAQPLQHPLGIDVAVRVVPFQDAQVPLQGYAPVGESLAEAHPALVKAAAVVGVAHESDAACAGGDQVLRQGDGAGGVLHGDQVEPQQGRGRAAVSVHENDGQAHLAEHVHVVPVKKLDAHEPGGLLQRHVGGQPAQLHVLRRQLVHHQGIAGPAELPGKGGEEEGAEMVVLRQVGGKQRDGLGAKLRPVRLQLRELPVAELRRLFHHHAPRGLRHGAPAVEYLGDRVPGQSAGVGDVLHGDAFCCHNTLS